jgi:hypothetical protein
MWCTDLYVPSTYNKSRFQIYSRDIPEIGVPDVADVETSS